MDTLKNRKASRAAKAENGGEQVPTQVTKDVKRPQDDTTEYVAPSPENLREQMRHSAEMDVSVSTENAQKEKAEALLKAINAPMKQAKQNETAERDAKDAAKSSVAKETAQQQANQKGTGAKNEEQQGGNGGGTGWTSGSKAKA